MAPPPPHHPLTSTSLIARLDNFYALYSTLTSTSTFSQSLTASTFTSLASLFSPTALTNLKSMREPTSSGRDARHRDPQGSAHRPNPR